MSGRIKDEVFGLARGRLLMSGAVTLGSSGAISSQTSAKYSGFTAAKTAGKTGRYTLTFDKAYAALESVNVTIEGATDAAYTTAKGIFTGVIRNNNISTTGKIDIQLCRTDTGADAEAIDSAVLHIKIEVRDAKLT